MTLFNRIAAVLLIKISVATSLGFLDRERVIYVFNMPTDKTPFVRGNKFDHKLISFDRINNENKSYSFTLCNMLIYETNAWYKIYRALFFENIAMLHIIGT